MHPSQELTLKGMDLILTQTVSNQKTRDLFPLIDITKELCKIFEIDLRKEIDMHIKIHEDNVGTLILGKLEPRRMTPHLKHYAIKYHWFREHIGLQNIQLVKINTEDQ